MVASLGTTVQVEPLHVYVPESVQFARYGCAPMALSTALSP